MSVSQLPSLVCIYGHGKFKSGIMYGFKCGNCAVLLEGVGAVTTLSENTSVANFGQLVPLKTVEFEVHVY